MAGAVSLGESCARTEVDRKERQVKKRLLDISGLADKEKRCLQQCVTSEISTGRGVAHEAKVLDKAEQVRPGRKIEHRNTHMRYLTIRIPFCGGTLRVGGRVDGIDETAMRVVEVKFRRYKLMGIRDYEKVQLELYLRMTDMKRATLMERYEGHTAEHEYERDASRWSQIQTGLWEFYREVIEQMEKDETQVAQETHDPHAERSTKSARVESPTVGIENLC